MKKHTEILETSVDEKIVKALGKDVIEELDTLSEDDLKDVIVNSLESMSEAAEKLAANPKYQELSEKLNDVTQGKKNVDKYQKAKIAYARKRLKEMGKLGADAQQELHGALLTAKRELYNARSANREAIKPRCNECGESLREAAVKGEASRLECYRCDTLPAEHNKAKAS